MKFNPGISRQSFDYNKIHKGEFFADIPYVMSMVGNMQEDIAGSLKDIKVTLKSLNNYLTDEQFNKNVKTSISNLSSVTEKLNQILSENRSGIQQLIANSNSLANNANKID